MTKYYEPREYQRIMINFMLSNLRCNVFASPGTGKTSSSLYAFDAMRMFGEAKRALVLAPKRVAMSTWPNEVALWSNFNHMSIAACVGTEAQRIAVLKSEPDIVCINYEQLPWLMEVLGDHWPFDTVFADESTKIKSLRITLQTSKLGNEFVRGQGSTRAKAISKVAHKRVRRWINLTGSPAPNGVIDLWGQCWFIDQGMQLGRSFTAFEDRFLTSVPTSEGYTRKVPVPGAQQIIEQLIKPYSIAIDARDWFDIKEPIESIIKVDLPPKARRAYETMEQELFAELESGVEIEAFHAGSKAQKLLQIGNGTVYTDPVTRAWEVVHDEKIEALKSLVTECNGESILVRYTHVPDKERILKAFPRARFLDDNPKTQDSWNAGNIPMLVAHAASAGHGLNLQHGGRVLCDYSSGYNLEEDEQIVERVGCTRQAQSGYDRAVYRYRIVAADTVEEHSVLPRIKYKMSVQDSLKNAVRIRRGMSI